MPHKPMRLNTIISVCCLKDLETWGITSEFIVRNIAANQYKVIVPDHEIADFIKISPPQFEIIGESRYTNQFRNQLFKLLSESKKDQFGWYLQQFIKLLAVADNHPTDTILIWDADTAPIAHLDFIDSDGRLLYYKSDEHHQPYFDTIKKLLNLDKRVNFSFIAQCFVIKAAWIQELFLEIETKHRMPWLDALLSHIDFNEGNGFSEYETLGTFISYKHPDEVLYIDRPWWRLGNSLINHIAFLSKRRAQELASSYDFISFEKWERVKPYFWKVTVPYFFKISLPKVINKIFS